MWFKNQKFLKIPWFIEHYLLIIQRSPQILPDFRQLPRRRVLAWHCFLYQPWLLYSSESREVLLWKVCKHFSGKKLCVCTFLVPKNQKNSGVLSCLIHGLVLVFLGIKIIYNNNENSFEENWKATPNPHILINKYKSKSIS